MLNRVPHPHRERARKLRRQGLTLAVIAEECGVTLACVSKWCRSMAENDAITARNTATAYRQRRIYPEGTQKFVTKLARLGVPAPERLRLAREAAAAERAKVGGRAYG